MLKVTRMYGFLFPCRFLCAANVTSKIYLYLSIYLFISLDICGRNETLRCRRNETLSHSSLRSFICDSVAFFILRYLLSTKMPRFYARKTDRIRSTSDQIQTALNLINNGHSIRSAAVTCGISRASLHRHVQRSKVVPGQPYDFTPNITNNKVKFQLML